jgi:preprotein translocase subunit SecA
MGLMKILEMQEQNLSLETQLSIHFSSNCYPPIPQGMIPTAVDAIDAYWDEDLDKMIPLPNGVSFRGMNEVAARDVINAYYLGAWCIGEAWEDEED